MMTRRETADILYPFSPRAENSRAYVSGVQDILCIIEGAYDTSAPSIPASGRTWFGVLHSIDVAPASNIYTFYAVNPAHSYKRVFTVPLTGGIIRVDDSIGTSFIVVDTDRIYRAVSGVHYMPDSGAEVEPARFAWRLDEVSSIKLANERRVFDPQTRAVLGDTVVYTVDTDGATLSLVDGYNCHLSYDETNKTLNIEAAPGEGLGLPTTIPWDNSAPAIDTGILTVNGINNKGDARINGGSGILLEYDDASITLKVRKSKDSA